MSGAERDECGSTVTAGIAGAGGNAAMREWNVSTGATLGAAFGCDALPPHATSEAARKSWGARTREG